MMNLFVIGLIIAISAYLIDIVFIPKLHQQNIQKALILTSGWVIISLIVALYFYYQKGGGYAIDYLTCYFMELTLSIDNLFVFILVFSNFKIPEKQQFTLLHYGILGAIIFRLLFITLFAHYINQYTSLFYVFGAILLYSAYKMAVNIYKNSSSNDGNARVGGAHNKYLVAISPAIKALIMIELYDVIFALDSVPAAFTITSDQTIIYISNVLAIVCLRSFFMIIRMIKEKFHYFEHGIIIIIAFISLKLLAHNLIHISSILSLIIIFSICLGAIILSKITKN